MPLSSSYQDALGAAQRGVGGSRRSLSRPTLARSTWSYVGRGRVSTRCTPAASSLQSAVHGGTSPSAAFSRTIASTSLDTQGIRSQGHVTDNHDAAVPVGVLTSAALARKSVQPAGQFTASLTPPSSRLRGNSLDGCSTTVSTRLSHRVAQRLSLAVPATFTSDGSAPSFVSRRCASLPSFQSRTTSLSRASAMGRTGSFPSQRVAAPPSPSSVGVSHIRPLLSSKEADYLNLAFQRSFVGRFRCATPVVVRTPAAATSHAGRPLSTTDDRATSQLHSSKEEQEETAASPAYVAATDAVGEGADNSVSASPGWHTRGVEAGAQHAVEASLPHAVIAGHPCSLAASDRPQPPLRRQVSGTGVATASNGTVGRGAGRGRPPPSLNGARPRGLLPSSSAPDVLRSTRAMKSCGLNDTPRAVYGGVPAVNMEPLVKSGLHTSLWLALQDGRLEVRSMANPNQLLASLPRSDPRVIITSLTEICGNRVVAGYTDGTLRVYDAVTMEETAEFRVHTGAVTCLLHVHGAPALSLPTTAATEPCGKRESAPTQSLLLTGSLDRSIVVWEAASMSYLHKLKGSLRGISALAATSTGGFAFSGSDDGTLRMWDAAQGLQLTITKEERADIAKRNTVTTSSTTAPLLHPLVSTSDVVPVAAGQSSTSASLDAMHEKEAEAGRERRASTPTTLSRRSFQLSLLNLASASPGALVTAGPSALSISPAAVGDHHHRRPWKHYSALKRSPLDSHIESSKAPFIEFGTRLPPPSADGGGLGSSFRLPSLPSSPLLPAEEIAAFAPTKTGTALSLLREGSVLVGPNGSISPLRCVLEQEAEMEGAGKGKALADSAAATDVHYRDDYRRGSAMLRKLRRDMKKRVKSLSGKRGAGVTSSTSGVATETKRKSTSAARATGESAKRKTTALKRATKSAMCAVESRPARTRWPVNSLEQRLELWLHLYQQRVVFSAASLQLMQLNSAGYDTVAAVNWPVECAHKECVTALTVVEDRLLVSTSRDATAKVFALPSGQYVRGLLSSRRMPLSSVIYDASVGRLYTAFSDGSLAAYDTRCAGLPLLSQIHPPHTILCSTFVQIRMAPMRRFVWAADAHEEAPGTSLSGSGGGGLSSVVVCAAQFDRTTMAHGPNQTATSYRVGQPSLRELNAAVSLQLLQQQRIRNLAEQATRTTRGMLEGIELTDMRRCGLVLERGYVRRHTSCVFARWRQWARRRALRLQCEDAVAVRAERCAGALLVRYAHRWLYWTRARKQVSARAVLWAVESQPGEVLLLSVESRVRAGRRRVWLSMAGAMEKQHQVNLLTCAYSLWREFQRAQQAHMRQCVAFNKLLLSMNASSYTPSSCILAQMARKATRSANQAKALWLLIKKTQSSQAHAFRRRYFDLWRVCARQRRCGAAAAAESREWSAVEPLSATLIQPQLLRRRYFALWQDFALYVSRSKRLSSELDTLQVEWVTLQRTLESPMTVGKMREKLGAAEFCAAGAGAEAQRLAARLETVAMEAATLRTEAALLMLIDGYRIPSVSHAVTPLLPPTASAATELTPTASLHRGSLASASTTPSNGCCCGDAMVWSRSPSLVGAYCTEEERAQRQEEDRLLLEVSALLRALKGNAMQYDRDDKLLSTAHAFALRLPIFEPAYCAQVSLEGSQGRQSQLLVQKQRTPRTLSAWPVSSAKRGGLTALSATLAPLQQRHRQTSLATALAGSASSSMANVALSTTSAARSTSAAQMWAAQPAEGTYACLADAFTAVFDNLNALLHAASLEYGTASATSRSAATQVVSGTAEVATGDDPTVFAPSSWLTQVPPKQRRAMIGEVLKLVTLFDSFTAHNDLPVECPGSISTRGSANARAMPLCSLCSRNTATALLERSSILLELVDPDMWPRQIKLHHLQGAYAAAIAELNTTVSTASCSGSAHHHTVMTLNTGGSGEQTASPVPSPLVMRPPALYLSDDLLQEAGAAMLQQDETTPGMTHSFGQLSIERRTNRSASSVQSGPTQATPPVSVAEAYAPARMHGTNETLNSMLKSLGEEGATPTSEPPHLRRHSFSHRSYSGVSTPRSYTPRTSTPSAAGTGSNGQLVKPYLGFRVNVIRDAQTLRRTTISIREVTPQYINAEGEDVDGPAQVAGLQVGDQLVRFAGYAVTDLAAFNAVVSRHVHSGVALPVVILRNGEQLCKTIVVGSRAVAGS